MPFQACICDKFCAWQTIAVQGLAQRSVCTLQKAHGVGHRHRTLSAFGRLPTCLQVEEKFETGGKMTEQEVIDSLRQVRPPRFTYWGCLGGLQHCSSSRFTLTIHPQASSQAMARLPSSQPAPALSTRPPASQTHSGQLQAVLDIVLSHQGAALKSALLQRLMSALVVPAPEHYRTLLRRLATLSGEAWKRGWQAQWLLAGWANALEPAGLWQLAV